MDKAGTHREVKRLSGELEKSGMNQSLETVPENKVGEKDLQSKRSSEKPAGARRAGMKGKPKKRSPSLKDSAAGGTLNHLSPQEPAKQPLAQSDKQESSRATEEAPDLNSQVRAEGALPPQAEQDARRLQTPPGAPPEEGSPNSEGEGVQVNDLFETSWAPDQSDHPQTFLHLAASTSFRLATRDRSASRQHQFSSEGRDSGGAPIGGGQRKTGAGGKVVSAAKQSATPNSEFCHLPHGSSRSAGWEERGAGTRESPPPTPTASQSATLSPAPHASSQPNRGRSGILNISSAEGSDQLRPPASCAATKSLSSWAFSQSSCKDPSGAAWGEVQMVQTQEPVRERLSLSPMPAFSEPAGEESAFTGTTTDAFPNLGGADEENASLTQYLEIESCTQGPQREENQDREDNSPERSWEDPGHELNFPEANHATMSPCELSVHLPQEAVMAPGSPRLSLSLPLHLQILPPPWKLCAMGQGAEKQSVRWSVLKLAIKAQVTPWMLLLEPQFINIHLKKFAHGLRAGRGSKPST
ncbi:hypothetical protein QTO34_002117 [Cnephaeus nilssonii]|uniref:Uncharacterized protein n=1 Tax=Cnephaeus nilssonii TaxID=3371016 RepID=A0AA40HU45_CNENI|nr:hypothetical protein QTO34_002117 [Eptesicus nilssonii]